MMVDSGHAVQPLRRGGNPMLEEVGHKIYMICPWTIHGDGHDSSPRAHVNSLNAIAGLLREEELCCALSSSSASPEDVRKLLRHLDGVVFISGWSKEPSGSALHNMAQSLDKDVYYIKLKRSRERILLGRMPELMARGSIVFERSKMEPNTFLLGEQVRQLLC
jgi:hypothetical protein